MPMDSLFSEDRIASKAVSLSAKATKEESKANLHNTFIIIDSLWNLINPRKSQDHRDSDL